MYEGEAQDSFGVVKFEASCEKWPVQGLEWRVWNLGFRVDGLGFRLGGSWLSRPHMARAA